jgi:hypothetical protein
MKKTKKETLKSINSLSLSLKLFHLELLFICVYLLIRSHRGIVSLAWEYSWCLFDFFCCCFSVWFVQFFFLLLLLLVPYILEIAFWLWVEGMTWAAVRCSPVRPSSSPSQELIIEKADRTNKERASEIQRYSDTAHIHAAAQTEN